MTDYFHFFPANQIVERTGLPALPGSSGFTLVELIVVLAVAGILASAAMPSLRQVFVKSKLATLTNALAGAFSYARTEAIVKNKRVTICALAKEATREAPKCTTTGDAWHYGWVIYVDDGATIYKIDPAEKILHYRDKVDGGFNLNNNCAGNPLRHLSYNSGGQARGSFTGADLVVSPPGSGPNIERHLCLARGGRVRVQDQYCTNPRPC